MSRSILVIDDEPHLRMMVRIALERTGFHVSEAASGEEGLALFADGASWDIVLVDQRMPGMDGLETLRIMRERRPGARVVMATAYPSIDLAVDAMKLGALDFVRKPMTPESLRRSIEAALGRAPAGSGPTEARPAPSSLPAAAPIEMLTMNGFHIVRAAEPAGESVPSDAGRATRRRFLVRSPEGRESAVTVAIDAAAVVQVRGHAHRAIPLESPFWTNRAESRLAAWLWETGAVPGDRLEFGPVTAEDLDLAGRWGEER